MPDANTYLTMIPLAAAALTAAIAVWLLLRAATRAIERFAARHEQEALFEEAAAFAKRLTKFVPLDALVHRVPRSQSRHAARPWRPRHTEVVRRGDGRLAARPWPSPHRHCDERVSDRSRHSFPDRQFADFPRVARRAARWVCWRERSEFRRSVNCCEWWRHCSSWASRR